jgi:hypothetical protein
MGDLAEVSIASCPIVTIFNLKSLEDAQIVHINWNVDQMSTTYFLLPSERLLE